MVRPLGSAVCILGAASLSLAERDVGSASAAIARHDILANESMGDCPKNMKCAVWCSLETQTMDCPDGQVIEVRSAYYNRRKKMEKNGQECIVTPPPDYDSTVRCPAEVKGDIGIQCNGHQECAVPPSVYCSRRPFSWIRFVWKCVDGVSADKALEVDSQGAVVKLPDVKQEAEQVSSEGCEAVVAALVRGYEKLGAELSAHCGNIQQHQEDEQTPAPCTGANMMVVDKGQLCSRVCLSLPMMDPDLKPPDEDETVRAACGRGLESLSPGLKAKALRAFHTLRVMDKFRSECKAEVKQCADELDRVRAPYSERLFHYMMKCGVLVTDVTVNALDGYAISDRVCDRTCQEAEELKVALEPVDFHALDELCADDQESTRLLERTFETVKQVNALDRAFKDCLDTTGVAMLCPDHSMVMHDCAVPGVTPESCEAKGCCYERPTIDRQGRAWCYKPQGKVNCEHKCPAGGLKAEWREECTFYVHRKEFADEDLGVRQKMCEEIGCCWDPLQTPDFPWCYHMPCVAE